MQEMKSVTPPPPTCDVGFSKVSLIYTVKGATMITGSIEGQVNKAHCHIKNGCQNKQAIFCETL